MAKIIEEREEDIRVAVDDDGHVLYNALQAGDPVIIRDYDDGTRHILNKQTGQLIVALVMEEVQP